MTKKDQEKVVVVTGSSAGLGRAIATEFAKKGMHIGLISRDEERLEDVKKQMESFGVRCSIVSCDVSDAQGLDLAAEKIEKELGPIDIWVNNAMTSIFSPFMQISPEEFRRVTEVTYLGYVYGTQTALKRMLPRNEGMIIQVGSALAYRGIPLQSAYCGAKHAVEGFTESVRCELLHDKSQVRITIVHMPALNTTQFSWVKSKLKRKPQPVPPIYQPEVGAKAVVWSAFHYRREWYVGLSTVIAIVGNKFFPGIGDQYLAKKGYDAQQYDGEDDPHRPSNLFETVKGNFGVHGNFDKRAKSFSFFLWLDQYSKILFFIFFVIVVFFLFI